MAFVLKIKHKETLRRWVVSQTLPEKSSDFSLTTHKLDLKVRELFHFAKDEALLITYVDKEGDVITVADDQDLVDACIVQGLNPLRLEVTIRGSAAGADCSLSLHEGSSIIESAHPASPLPNPNDSERASKHAFPQATADAIKQFVQKYTQNIDPNLQPAVLLKNIQKALRDFVKTLVHEGQRLAPRNVVPSSGRASYARCPSQPTMHSSPIADLNQFVHYGVRCDGCDLYPIKGLRYKSTKVFNYDLCSVCFSKLGNESDYQRIEKPLNLRCHGFLYSSSSVGKAAMKWMSPFASGSDGWKSECPFLHSPLPHRQSADASKKYDAIFVKDVSFDDRLELAPGVHFTRILRLKNTGSLPWHQGTQFVHIGGDKLTLGSAVVLKLPEAGLSVGLYYDVSIEMRAPEKAGNYIAHWCLMAPCGEKFGQSVWTAIQVVGKMNEPHQVQVACKKDDITQTVEEASKIQSKVEHAPVSVTQTVEEASKIESKVEHAPVSEATQNKVECAPASEAIQTRVECTPVSEANDSSSLSQSEALGSYKTHNGSSLIEKAAESTQFIVSSFTDRDHATGDSDSDDMDGFSMVEKPADVGNFKMQHTSLAGSQLAFSQPTNVIQEQYATTNSMQLTRQELNLRELELMGFTNRNLNTILLEKNKQDLQLTLDDLLLGSGWNNLLKDLEEMGFDDANTNLRLLIKNEGSIKRVVKELMELEKLKPVN